MTLLFKLCAKCFTISLLSAKASTLVVYKAIIDPSTSMSVILTFLGTILRTAVFTSLRISSNAIVPRIFIFIIVN